MHHWNNPRALVGIVAVSLLSVAADAAVTLPKIISDRMVIQRGVEVPIWGKADPAESVTVSIAGQTVTATAGQDGKWMVKLKAVADSGPHTLTVKGSKSELVTVNDVLAGEVWICSGQSNMEWTVVKSRDFAEEKAAANFPHIRHFKVQKMPSPTPQEDVVGQWVECKPETVGEFTAAGYFFGRELHQKLKAPVGLINTTWGGTPIEAWTSMEAQRTLPSIAPLLERWDKSVAAFDEAAEKLKYEAALEKWKAATELARTENKPLPKKPVMAVNQAKSPNKPANLFNGMVAPLVPYAAKGAIWYQGESNGGGQFSKEYGNQLALLIKDWRARFGNLYFAWVQLPEFQPQDKGEGWCFVREGMLKTLSVPNTGMAVAMGLGEANDIHPKNKQDVGKRLALWARAKVYGENIPYSGPLYSRSEVKGSDVVISFDYSEGLKTTDGGPVKGLVIAGEDKVWKPAVGRIEGGKLIVSSPEVPNPVAARYAWAKFPEFNLENGAGLPASPFRTDRW